MPPRDAARYTHVIWDWNGTLLDDVDLARRVVDAMLLRRGLPGLDRTRYHEIFDIPITSYYERAGFDFGLDPFAALADEFHSRYGARWRGCGLRLGAEAALAALRAGGVEQSVLSASQQAKLDEQVDHFGLRAYFREVAGIDDHHAGGKQAQGRALMRELACDPRRVLLVGDTVHDYEVAEEVGVSCVLIANGHQPRSRLERSGAPVLDSLGELMRWARVGESVEAEALPQEPRLDERPGVVQEPR
jgi:phosphoglycolate phosphatase